MPSRARRRRRYTDDLGVLGLPGDVSPWDVRFDPADPADLETIADGRLRVRVHAEPGLTEGQVVLRSEDGVEAIPLDPVPAGRFVLWSATLDAPESPVGMSFAFRVESSGHPVYVVPSGVSASVERLDRWTIEPGRPPITAPEWAKGAVIYQIFPDRFANGDPANDPPGTVRWGSPPRARQFQGGDLDGIAARLAHLEHLGVDAIYLNPIFTSPSNHRYDTIDYRSVDPALGGDEALHRLVAAAHRRNIRIILDASFNHVHPRFFAFADLLENGARSRYRGWFVVDDWPARIRVRPHRAGDGLRHWIDAWRTETDVPIEELTDDGPAVDTTYQTWCGVPTMPRVDLSHPAARRYFLEVARYWIEAFDIDGWRMDVARYVDPDFWPDFREACRQAKPDAYLLAEVMGDVREWLQGDGFDATMNYVFRALALRFFATGETDGGAFLDHATRLYGRHALATTLVNHNLIGSHDTPRFRTAAGGELWRVELATIFQLTFPGAPGIYYGDEVGLSGGDDPGCRGAMPWDDLADRRSLVDTVAQLTALRRRVPALRVGEYAPLAASGEAVAFSRFTPRARYVIGINRSRARQRLAVPGSGETIWGAGSLVGGELSIAGRSGVVIRF